MSSKRDRVRPPLPVPPTPAPPAGFFVNAVSAGIKKSGKLDFGVIISPFICSVAGVFTQNAFCAAPVKWDRKIVATGRATGLVVNSGNANCATGEKGEKDCAAMAALVARWVGVEPEQILVASTGVIGVPMPMPKVRLGVNKLVGHLNHSPQAWENFVEAIRTTDTVRKMAGASFKIAGREIRILGVAKGSGMIHPNMATMLAFIATDAAIDPKPLKAIFAPIAGATFNSLTVDGDTSTNDTALVLANGAAGNPPIKAGTKEARAFGEALEEVCSSLAYQLVRDGEGATKVALVRVEGAASAEDARKAARSVATSMLVKSALYGEDANWGRIACAVGYSGAKVSPEKTDIFIGPMQLLKKGRPVKFSEARALEILKQEEILITVKLNLGKHSATYFTCDLTYEYVRINADYRS
ncbi:MAG: bifunctional glutamate N-acetyltransferase/amino-acid acetyltransferase ArgJ [Candidatus Sumerlaeota bacterium]|nr:bifunctional glutamate N-acetyltransferase/amino-acid acetyltransferase ArgJ [Candidatus Sumerlaeota bacterium]